MKKVRTYGRVPDAQGNLTVWVVVETTPDGDDTYVYLTTLIQVLKLNLNEAPYNSDYGIPAKSAVILQTHPDYYSTITQQQFAPYFASLTITAGPLNADGDPTYAVNVTTKSGTKMQLQVGQ